jgi:hypothetical protein
MNVVAIVSALGLGGIFGAILTAILQRRNEVKRIEHELKKKRYECALMLMWAKLEPLYFKMVQQTNRPELINSEYLDSELKAELVYSLLFASDDVIRSLNGFIEKPCIATLETVALYVRRDLWGKRSKLSKNDLTALQKRRG